MLFLSSEKKGEKNSRKKNKQLEQERKQEDVLCQPADTCSDYFTGCRKRSCYFLLSCGRKSSGSFRPSASRRSCLCVKPQNFPFSSLSNCAGVTGAQIKRRTVCPADIMWVSSSPQGLGPLILPQLQTFARYRNL